MLLYIIIIFIYFILGLLELNYEFKKTWKYVVILVLPMFILVAIRAENIGNDTAAYAYMYDMFSQNNTISDLLLSSGQETGYLITAWLFSSHGYPYIIFQIVISSFVYFSLICYFKCYSFNIAMACLLFMADGFMGGSMNVVRMYIAISILLYSLKYIVKRSFLPFFIIVLFATLFHSSALIFIVMYPLCIIRYNSKLLILLLGVSIVILILGSSFFSFITEKIGMYNSYVSKDRFEDANKLAVFINLLINISILIYAKSCKLFDIYQYNENVDMNGNVILNVNFRYICMIALYITIALSIIGLSNNIMSRLIRYFSIFNIILITNSFNNINNIHRRIFNYVVIAVFYMLQFFTILILRPNWNHLVPYESFFK